jgi:hypothetical protein
MSVQQPSFLALAIRSYVADLRKWFGGMMRRYELAIGLLLAGAIALIVAIGVGISATFHIIEVRYGIWGAYVAVGGFFLTLGLITLLAGTAMLKRPLPSVPRPHRQVDTLKRSVVMSISARFLSVPIAACGGKVDHASASRRCCRNAHRLDRCLAISWQ